MAEIDWSAPLEAYHPDGRVVEVSNVGRYKNRLNEVSGLEVCLFTDGGLNIDEGIEWRIRNRPVDSDAVEALEIASGDVRLAEAICAFVKRVRAEKA